MLKVILGHLHSSFTDWALEMEQNGVSLLKLQGAKVYVIYLTYIRRIVTIFYWTLFCTFLATLGLIGLAISFTLLVTQTVTIPLELLYVEMLFVLVPMSILFILNSERAWIKRSGLKQLIDEVQSPAESRG